MSLAQFPEMLERTIISDGASKTWARTGWRLGFTANRALAPVFTRLCDQHRFLRLADHAVGAVEAMNGPQNEAKQCATAFSRGAI